MTDKSSNEPNKIIEDNNVDNNTSIEVSKPQQQYNSLIPTFKDREDFMDFLGSLVKGKKINANTKEEALGIYIKSQELGLGFMSASDHMLVVNGKTGIDIHILRALLLKAGTIVWKRTESYRPLYKYIDGSNNLYTEDTLPSTAVIVNNKEENDAAKDKGKLPVSFYQTKGSLIPYDYRTSYHFKRTIKNKVNGEIFTIEETSSFSYLEAKNALLMYKSDGATIAEHSPWIKYPKLMLDTRAFTFGARAIADDILMGCYETSELYDINHITYNVDANGNIIKT